MFLVTTSHTTIPHDYITRTKPSLDSSNSVSCCQPSLFYLFQHIIIYGITLLVKLSSNLEFQIIHLKLWIMVARHIFTRRILCLVYPGYDQIRCTCMKIVWHYNVISTVNACRFKPSFKENSTGFRNWLLSLCYNVYLYTLILLQTKLADVSIKEFRRLTVMVVSSIRTERAKTRPEGCDIVSRVNNRIVMKIPKGAYTEEEDISMKVCML